MQNVLKAPHCLNLLHSHVMFAGLKQSGLLRGFSLFTDLMKCYTLTHPLAMLRFVAILYAILKYKIT